jgi:hypothetical protein
VRFILAAVGLGGGEQAAVREGGEAVREEERAVVARRSTGGRRSVRRRSRGLPTRPWEKGLEEGNRWVPAGVRFFIS